MEPTSRATSTSGVEEKLRKAEDRIEAGREELRSRVEEKEALRRVATRVASGGAEEALDALAAEVAQLTGAEWAFLLRYDSDAAGTIVASRGTLASLMPVGTDLTLGAGSIVLEVLRTGRAARVTDYSKVSGYWAAVGREAGVRSGVGAPVKVEGRLWGAMLAASTRAEPLPAGTEDRLAEFAELAATAVANAESRAELRAHTEEQAALRRVATLVAHGVRPAEIFSAVSEEVGRLFGSEAAIARFEADGSTMVVLGMTPGIPVISIGTRWELEDFLASTVVYRTGRPARSDHTGLRHASGQVADSLRQMNFVSTVAVPIVVQGDLWGVMTASHAREALPGGTEERLEKFTELVGAAIANAESRAELAASEARAHDLAREQAGLRRVATLVAKREEAGEVFPAVAQEVERVFGVQLVTICRYESEGILVLSSSGIPAFPAGSRWPLDIPSLPALIYETGSAARIDDYANATGLDALARDAGIKGAIGAPILVDGCVWGSINIATTESMPLPDDVEQRLSRFTDLVATSVWNATMRSELDASRARIVATADATRRRIERDLHDGAQQRVVSLALEVRAVQEAVPPELTELRAELSHVAGGLTGVVDGLREIALGIHPALLTEGGLGPALRTLARRSAVPVELDVRAEGRLPEPVEVAAYYVVSEALTNAAKYAQASVVHIAVEAQDGVLRVSVRDDGVGGADPAQGSGLLGLKDRAEAIGGRISLESAPDRGTALQVELPLTKRDG